MAYEGQYLLNAPQNVSVYQGQPLDETAAAMEKVAGRHYQNLDNLNSVALAIGSAQLMESDKEFQNAMTNNIRGYISDIVDQGHLGNATAAVTAKARDFMTDQRFQYAARNAEKERKAKEREMELGTSAFRRKFDEGQSTMDPETGQPRLLDFQVEEHLDWNAPKQSLWQNIRETGRSEGLSEGEISRLAYTLFNEMDVEKGIFSKQITDNLRGVIELYKSSDEYEQEKYGLMNHGPEPLNAEQADEVIGQRVLDMGMLRVGTTKDIRTVSANLPKPSTSGSGNTPARGEESVLSSGASQQKIEAESPKGMKEDFENAQNVVAQLKASNAPIEQIQEAEVSVENLQNRYNFTVAPIINDYAEKYWQVDDVQEEYADKGGYKRFREDIEKASMESDRLSIDPRNIGTALGLNGLDFVGSTVANILNEARGITKNALSQYAIERIPHSFMSITGKTDVDGKTDPVTNSQIAATKAFTESANSYKLTGFYLPTGKEDDKGALMQVGTSLSGADMNHAGSINVRKALQGAGADATALAKLSQIDLSKTVARPTDMPGKSGVITEVIYRDKNDAPLMYNYFEAEDPETQEAINESAIKAAEWKLGGKNGFEIANLTAGRMLLNATHPGFAKDVNLNYETPQSFFATIGPADNPTKEKFTAVPVGDGKFKLETRPGIYPNPKVFSNEYEMMMVFDEINRQNGG